MNAAIISPASRECGQRKPPLDDCGSAGEGWRLLIDATNGSQIPLDQVATIDVRKGALNISRELGVRVASIGVFIRYRDMGSVVEAGGPEFSFVSAGTIPKNTDALMICHVCGNPATCQQNLRSADLSC